MKFIHKNTQHKFIVNLGLLHLAMEQAQATAASRELIRQFSEQYPNARLTFNECDIDFPHFERLDLTIDGYTIEWINP